MDFLSDGLLPGRISQINALLLELLWLGYLITQRQSETGTEPMVTIQGEVPCIFVLLLLFNVSGSVLCLFLSVSTLTLLKSVD